MMSCLTSASIAAIRSGSMRARPRIVATAFLGTSPRSAIASHARISTSSQRA
jgi:hypothetical protein